MLLIVLDGERKNKKMSLDFLRFTEYLSLVWGIGCIAGGMQARLQWLQFIGFLLIAVFIIILNL